MVHSPGLVRRASKQGIWYRSFLFPRGLERRVLAAELVASSVEPLKERVLETRFGHDVVHHWTGAATSRLEGLAPEAKFNIGEKLQRLHDLDKGNKAFREQLLVRLDAMQRNGRPPTKREADALRDQVNELMRRTRMTNFSARDIAREVLSHELQATTNPSALQITQELLRQLEEERREEREAERERERL